MAKPVGLQQSDKLSSHMALKVKIQCEICMISLVGHYADFELEYLQVPELNWKIYTFSFIF